MDTSELTDISTSWHSYPSIYNVGHKAIASLLTAAVNVEEKVDGSQFSFGLHANTDTPVVRLENGVEYGLKVRSKGAVMHPDAPMDMFKRGVAAVKDRIALLRPGWTYRGEFLAKPNHNALAYDRVPNGHVIIFDINPGHEAYLSYEAKAEEARRIGFEVVPLLFSGKVTDIEQFRSFLDRTSVLGGQKIEGVVIKPSNYGLFGLDKKVLLGKFVSEAFKEVHRKTWGESNPTGADIITLIGNKFTTAARWNKAIQHLAEAGTLEGSPRDIGLILREIPIDVLKECEDEIKADLFKWAWPHIKRATTRGFPEFYKQKLLERQFEDGVAATLGPDDFCVSCMDLPCKGTTAWCKNNLDKPAFTTGGDPGDEQ